MTKIAAYYYPGWHRTGTISNPINEWDCVKDAKSYFDGHNQPRIPALGYLDDSLKSTLEKQVALAESHGVDAFIFDWYWKKSQRPMEKSVRRFMDIETNMEFALMWSWKLSRHDFPVPLSKVNVEDHRWIETNTKDFLNLLEYCSENYFNKKNYWKVDGKPYFVMYFVDGFIDKLGKDQFSELIKAGDSYLKTKDYNGLYSVGVVSNCDASTYGMLSDLKNMGFSALTGYNFLADFRSNNKLIQDYSTQADIRKDQWNTIKDISQLPYIPSISAGWDATPRGVKLDELTEGLPFPWSPIVVNNTPENFGKHLNQGLDFINKTGQDTIHICAWNEWSEGAYIEPDTKYGTGFLDQIKNIKGQ
jgi:hypothetical protein